MDWQREFEAGEPDFHTRELADKPWYREELSRAHVIVGLDLHTGDTTTLFGREMLHLISDSGIESPIRQVRVAYDSSTEELEYLCAAVQVLKGSCEYPGRGVT